MSDGAAVQQRRLRRVLATLGVALSLAGMAFVIRELARSSLVASIAWSNPAIWLALLVGALFYGVLGALIAAAWVAQVRALHPGAPLALSFAVNAYTQVFKYLPVNVLHQAGRVVLLKQRGVPVAASASAAVGEAALIGASALAISLAAGLGPSLLAQSLTNAQSRMAWAGTLAVILALGGLVWFGRGSIGERYAFFAQRGRRWLVAAAGSTAAYLLFFAANAVAAERISRIAVPAMGEIAGPTLVAAIAAAWLIGFVTPGASAGFGVREAAFILLAAPSLGRDSATIVALVFRIINLGGDLALALCGLVLLRVSASRGAVAKVRAPEGSQSSD